MCADLNRLRYDDPLHKVTDKIFNDLLTALDNEVAGMPAGELAPGRLLKFGVADGYALYIIAKVGKRQTEVVHLPYMDAWHFAGVYQTASGKLVLPTQVAIKTLGWSDALRRMFDSGKGK